METYAAKAKRLLVEELGEDYACEDDLVDLYALLVLVKGEECSLEDVHEAWAVWTMKTRPEHPSLVPFGQLTEEIAEYDRPYKDAISRAASLLDPFPEH